MDEDTRFTELNATRWASEMERNELWDSAEQHSADRAHIRRVVETALAGRMAAIDALLEIKKVVA